MTNGSGECNCFEKCSKIKSIKLGLFEGYKEVCHDPKSQAKGLIIMARLVHIYTRSSFKDVCRSTRDSNKFANILF